MAATPSNDILPFLFFSRFFVCVCVCEKKLKEEKGMIDLLHRRPT